VLAELALSSGCIHRWKISSPVGEACRGSCLLCGAERSFSNVRFPFGQPARTRRTGAPVRSGVATAALLPGSMSSFLLQHRAQLNDAALQD
jgi:hypothetical protein